METKKEKALKYADGNSERGVSYRRNPQRYRDRTWAFIKGYEAAEQRIACLEEALENILKLSERAGIFDSDAFLKEWEEWQCKAKELLKVK